MNTSPHRIGIIILQIVSFIPTFLLWSLSTIIILWLFLSVLPDGESYDPINQVAIVSIVLIFVGHIIAFSVVPLSYILSKYSFTKARLIVFMLAGIGALGVQYFFRLFSDSLGRLDCGDNCVESVMPKDLGSIVNAGVLFTLVLLLAFYTFLAFRKYKKSLES